jgi:hypothetical protein
LALPPAGAEPPASEAIRSAGDAPPPFSSEAIQHHADSRIEIQLSSKNPVAKAINYSLKRWTAMTRFLADGRICLSNNAAERSLAASPSAGTT